MGLVGDFRAAFSPAASKNLTAVVGGHSGTEPRFVAVFYLGRLISFFHTLSSESDVRADRL